MPSEGKLLISVTAEVDGDDVIVSVSDNGVGMTEEARLNILHPESSTGLGIAVKNVRDRICGHFGPGTHMEVESELGAAPACGSCSWEAHVANTNEGASGAARCRGARRGIAWGEGKSGTVVRRDEGTVVRYDAECGAERGAHQGRAPGRPLGAGAVGVIACVARPRGRGRMAGGGCSASQRTSACKAKRTREVTTCRSGA